MNVRRSIRLSMVGTSTVLAAVLLVAVSFAQAQQQAMPNEPNDERSVATGVQPERCSRRPDLCLKKSKNKSQKRSEKNQKQITKTKK